MTLRDLLELPAPVLALAPMQDVTDLPFWTLMTRYGGADLYFTEYFRVTAHYRPERGILESITRNPTGRPVVAQMIGNDPEALARTARELERHPVAGIDLNLGCPAPVVYRKCAGGGLLRDPARIDNLLATLRGAVSGPFTVKTRVGFGDAREFEQLLDVFSRHSLDLLTVHGRTVAGKYSSAVDLGPIARAVDRLPFPVLANGNVWTADDALCVLAETKARGLMIGRGAVRNPWIFSQIRDRLAGRPPARPSGAEVLAYIRDLYEATCPPVVRESCRVQKMKRYMNFIADGYPGSPDLLHRLRRADREAEFFGICGDFFGGQAAVPVDIFHGGSGFAFPDGRGRVD